MKEKYIEFLCCPSCKGNLNLTKKTIIQNRVEEGKLECIDCGNFYEITNSIPRFVRDKGYAASFGSQWNTFARSQIDTDKIKESALRFESEIGWKRSDIEGKKVLEVGSGAGRFIDVISRNNAELAIGMDITDAVDASKENFSDRDNVFFIQGDIFNSPIKDCCIDLAYSIGVLHHTPDPEISFRKMVDLVVDEGKIGLSLYEISLYSRPNRIHKSLLWNYYGL